MPPLVSVSLVTWNSFDYLPLCLKHLNSQEGVNIELIVTDNGSMDGTLDYLHEQPNLILLEMGFNSGYCAAHNKAISIASGDYILVLNPDVFMVDDFLKQMVVAIELDGNVGQVSGKLYQISKFDDIGKSTIIDSTGMYFTPNHRHFDRGSGELDQGQYNKIEYVFGVSGAAVLYRKKALEETMIYNEYFDEDFFAYREDADLSWRMQIMGWKSIYTPYAVAYHIRRLRPTARRYELPPDVNMHSIKNRFLMRVKNQTRRNALNFFWPTIWRDILVIGGTLTIEYRSLPALWRLFSLFPRVLAKRKIIMSRKKVTDMYLAQWFSNEPVSRSF